MKSSNGNSDFHFEVFQRADGYAIFSRKYGIVVRNGSVDAGAIDLKNRIDALKADFEALQIPFETPKDTPAPNENAASGSQRRTVQTAAIVASIVVLLVIAAAYPAASFLSGIKQSISSVLPQESGVDGVGRSAINLVNRLAAATEQITPERERELQESLSKIATKIAPLMRTVTEPFATTPGKASCP